MLPGFKKNRLLFLPIIFLVFTAGAQEPASVQASSYDSTRFHIDTIRITLKEPIKHNPLLDQTINRPSNELMYWSNYPLTAQQIEERDRIRNRTFGGQIVHDVIENGTRSIINRKKNRPPATVPRF